MTRDEAVQQVKAFFKLHGIDSPGLNEKGVGGVSLGAADVFFEYQPEAGALKCSALIYRVRGVPHPGVVAAFQEEEKAGSAGTGGGRIDYQAPSRGVYLSRVYPAPVELPRFSEELQQLMEASGVWRAQVVERVAERAHAKGGPQRPG